MEALPLFIKRSQALKLTGWSRRVFQEVMADPQSPVKPAFRHPGSRGDAYVSAPALLKALNCSPEEVAKVSGWLFEAPAAITTGELCVRCGLSRSSLAVLRRHGILRPLEIPGHHPRYSKPALARLAGLE